LRWNSETVLKKIKLSYEVRDVPVFETEKALHVRKIGVLEKLSKEPTKKIASQGLIEHADTAFLQARAGTDFIAGLGIFLSLVVAMPTLYFSIGMFLEYAIDSKTNQIDFAMAIMSTVGGGFMLLGALQMFLMDWRDNRDMHYRFCRHSRKLYAWRFGRLVVSNFDDLIPCHRRVGTVTAANGYVDLVDYDPDNKVIRYIHNFSVTSPFPEDSQAAWEYLRRYIDGEFEHWPVQVRSPELAYGYFAVMRNYFPARWGRALIRQGGIKAPLGILVTLLFGIIVALPWLFITYAHGRLKGPDWSGIPKQELTPDPAEEAAHPELVKFDPVKSTTLPVAAWEKPLYIVAMTLGMPLWLAGVYGAFYFAHMVGR
jgi:hypothetical protein